MNAILHDLVLKVLPVDDAQVESLEEGRDSRKEADALNSAGLCLIEESTDKEAACAFSHCVAVNCDRTDFGEMTAVDVQRRAAQELAGAGFGHGEGVNVLGYLVAGTGKEGSVAGEAVD